MIKHGFPPYLECSSRGDKRFSAFFAKIRQRENKSIEVIYQAAKVFEDGSTGLTWDKAKGKLAVNQSEVNILYRRLWREFMQENPNLLPELMKATGMSDMFGQPGTVCQATELWNIRIEAMDKELGIKGNLRVTNKRRGSPLTAERGEQVLSVDRSNPVLGNPFILNDVNNHKERDRVINQYREKLYQDMAVQGPMFDAIAEISARMMQGEELCLDCWCAPLPCHADVIRDAAIELAWKQKLGLSLTRQAEEPEAIARSGPGQGNLF